MSELVSGLTDTASTVAGASIAAAATMAAGASMAAGERGGDIA